MKIDPISQPRGAHHLHNERARPLFLSAYEQERLHEQILVTYVRVKHVCCLPPPPVRSPERMTGLEGGVGLANFQALLHALVDVLGVLP